MFGLWYFSLALEEIRKRFGFINRIFIFFTGNDISSNSPALTDAPTEQPACEPKPKEDLKPAVQKPVDNSKPSGVEELPKPVETPPKPAPVQPIQPAPKVEAPVKPAPPKPAPVAVPEPKPVEVPKPIVEPAKPAKVEVPAVPAPIVPKEQPKPTPAPKIPEPATNGHAKPAAAVPEPSAKPAPPTADDARPLKPTSAEDAPLAASATQAKAVELPASNEDSFIIVEQQKPKGPAPTPATVRNSTMDFLRAEGGGGGRSAPAAAPAGQATR